MITLSQLTELLGWVSLINLAYLMLATFSVVIFKGPMISIHMKMFRLDEKQLDAKYLDFLANFKIVTLAFFVAPYIALKIMGQ